MIGSFLIPSVSHRRSGNGTVRKINSTAFFGQPSGWLFFCRSERRKSCIAPAAVGNGTNHYLIHYRNEDSKICVFQFLKSHKTSIYTEENEYSMYLTQRIGNTTYRVKVIASEKSTGSLEDALLRLVRNRALAFDGRYGIINTPQGGHPQVERMTS